MKANHSTGLLILVLVFVPILSVAAGTTVQADQQPELAFVYAKLEATRVD